MYSDVTRQHFHSVCSVDNYGGNNIDRRVKMTNARKIELYEKMLNHITDCLSINDLKYTLTAIGFTDSEIEIVISELSATTMHVP